MLAVVKNSWALLLGMLLLMLGNGLQGTLLGVRGAAEGFSTGAMSIVMSAYFLGFLGGSRMAPAMIRRVGHVRVFAALASLISAVLVLYAAAPNPIAWALMRVVIGFCFAGVYVVAESWLNDASTNENRGQTMSIYLIVQMIGIVTAQGLMNVADPQGYTLFIIASVLVSISFAPILLSVSPAPVFERTKPMTLRQLFGVSPLGFVGAFLLGAIFSALFGMSSIFATQIGLSVREISIFVGSIYLGGMLWQYPIGWFSDRMDRRLLITGLNLFGAIVMVIALLVPGNFIWLLVLAFVVGGVSNPLYSLYIAYTNDFLEIDDMAAASGGLIFINGIGAIAGPMVLGWMMETWGPYSFFGYIGGVMFLMTGYALYRMTQRSAPSVEDTSSYAPIAPTSSPVAVELAVEVAVEMALEEEGNTNDTNSTAS
ncbi:MAG: MFS transporter [Alphaproteobacteria bacterium]|nr:MFS transporter [Alphaproteobacteria bacterium]